MSVSRLRGSSKLVILLALVGALGAGAALQRSGAIGEEPRKEVNPATLRHAEALSEAFHDAAELAMPAVVTIRSKVKAHPVAKNRDDKPRQGVPENPFKGSPLEEFFNGKNFEDFAPQQPRQGMGSGVIIDPSGLVMTNNHVVEGADEVVVHLADGREFKGEDIKTDERTDLAVIRIRGAGTLPAVTLGDSDKLRVGDWVMAIGHPFELEQTVSAGIISGLGRELGSVRRAKFLQTDAAINPGNSGGPLINLHGEVIGINTAIATDNGRFQGVGFAIPINLAKWVTNQLIKQGSVQRAYLGVKLQEMNPNLAEKLGAHRGEGVLVAQVFPNTPAAEAGFERGDVITGFAGNKVKDRGDLQTMVERVPVNSKQDVEVLRDGRPLTLHVTAKAMPNEFDMIDKMRRPGRGTPGDSSSFETSDLGIEVANISDAQAEELGVKPNSGVVITKADADKPGYEHDLRAGMVITRVGKKPVKNIDDFKAALKEESLKDGILLHVHDRNVGDSLVVVRE